jgi:predicted nuclease of predicted toxin-antitoxin system
VKLLFDENLSPRLPARVESFFPGSAHVHDCGLGAAGDELIWEYAAANQFTLVTKDLDFYDRSMVHGSPPKVVWLRTGNCTTSLVETLLEEHHREVLTFFADPTESLLLLP